MIGASLMYGNHAEIAFWGNSFEDQRRDRPARFEFQQKKDNQFIRIIMDRFSRHNHPLSAISTVPPSHASMPLFTHLAVQKPTVAKTSTRKVAHVRLASC